MTVRLKLKMTMDLADNAQEVLGQFIRRLSGFAAGEDTPQSALSAFLILENYYISAGSVKNGIRRREKIRNRAAEQTVLTKEEILEEQEKMRRMHLQRNGISGTAETEGTDRPEAAPREM